MLQEHDPRSVTWPHGVLARLMRYCLHRILLRASCVIAGIVRDCRHRVLLLASCVITCRHHA